MALAIHQPERPSWIPNAPPAKRPIAEDMVNQLLGIRSRYSKPTAIIAMVSDIDPPTNLRNLPRASILHSLGMVACGLESI